jgi:hypothetical protein
LSTAGRLGDVAMGAAVHTRAKGAPYASDPLGNAMRFDTEKDCSLIDIPQKYPQIQGMALWKTVWMSAAS